MIDSKLFKKLIYRFVLLVSLKKVYRNILAEERRQLSLLVSQDKTWQNGMVWYSNCLFDKIKSTLKHNSKYIISESQYIIMSGDYTQRTNKVLASM